jgi:hypothetical protein
MRVAFKPSMMSGPEALGGEAAGVGADVGRAVGGRGDAGGWVTVMVGRGAALAAWRVGKGATGVGPLVQLVNNSTPMLRMTINAGLGNMKVVTKIL